MRLICRATVALHLSGIRLRCEVPAFLSANVCLTAINLCRSIWPYLPHTYNGAIYASLYDPALLYATVRPTWHYDTMFKFKLGNSFILLYSHIYQFVALYLGTFSFLGTNGLSLKSRSSLPWIFKFVFFFFLNSCYSSGSLSRFLPFFSFTALFF